MIQMGRKSRAKHGLTFRKRNQHMKRSVLIAALAALTLTGCSKEAPPPPPPAPVTAPEAAPPPPAPAADAAKDAAAPAPAAGTAAPAAPTEPAKDETKK